MAQRVEERTNPDTVSWAMKERRLSDEEAASPKRSEAPEGVVFVGEVDVWVKPSKPANHRERMASQAAIVRAQSRRLASSAVRNPEERPEPKCACAIQ